jgi:hypothetical protein
MSLKGRVLLFRALLCGCAIAAAMYADRLGNMIFTPPSGWTRVPQSNGVAFASPAKNPQDAAVLFVLPDQELKGDFRAAFNAVIESRVKEDGHVLQRSQPQVFPSNTGAKSLFAILVVRDAAGREAVRTYMAFNAGNRIDVVELAAPNREIFQQNQPVLKSFLSHLQFTGTAPKQ